jgi:hypothetical protein
LLIAGLDIEDTGFDTMEELLSEAEWWANRGSSYLTRGIFCGRPHFIPNVNTQFEKCYYEEAKKIPESFGILSIYHTLSYLSNGITIAKYISQIDVYLIYESKTFLKDDDI